MNRITLRARRAGVPNTSHLTVCDLSPAAAVTS